MKGIKKWRVMMKLKRSWMMKLMDKKRQIRRMCMILMLKLKRSWMMMK